MPSTVKRSASRRYNSMFYISSECGCKNFQNKWMSSITRRKLNLKYFGNIHCVCEWLFVHGETASFTYVCCANRVLAAMCALCPKQTNTEFWMAIEWKPRTSGGRWGLIAQTAIPECLLFPFWYFKIICTLSHTDKNVRDWSAVVIAIGPSSSFFFPSGIISQKLNSIWVLTFAFNSFFIVQCKQHMFSLRSTLFDVVQ